MTSSTYDFLLKELEGKIAQPHSDGYEASLKSYFTVQETELRPAFIIFPTSAHDVSRILKSLAACDAGTKAYTKVAVRGGGHSPFAGSANVNDGITIDLRSINTVEVNETRSIASIGGGAIWGHVYEKLDPLGLSVLGGHVYDVGVGGFTLGGGFSSLSPRYGMCCDMVENFEVVLANGEIINANANENSDLWTALKGGSNNFGIVTRMGNDWDPYGSLKLSITFSPQTKFTIASNFEYTKEDSAPDVFRAFMDIAPQYRNTMKITTLSETAKDIQKLQANGVRQIFATTSFYYSAAHLQNIYSLFKNAVASVENTKGIRWTLTYWRIHSSVATKSAAYGGNSTGLDTSGGSLVLCVLTYSWEDASDDEAMNGAAKLFIEEVDKLSSDAGLFNRYKYVNYSAGYQDPISGYGDEMKAKLQETSKKYDPEGFFQTNVPGGFKIFLTTG
ncbi:oxidoreductase FAD-binding protein [Rutstroemia sp. NJR-2017a BBW]|nr:oxidoreductase FAD-binding protein [Rutstroemia sp. NJR-2017a BBW]